MCICRAAEGIGRRKRRYQGCKIGSSNGFSFSFFVANHFLLAPIRIRPLCRRYSDGAPGDLCTDNLKLHVQLSASGSCARFACHDNKTVASYVTAHSQAWSDHKPLSARPCGFSALPVPYVFWLDRDNFNLDSTHQAGQVTRKGTRENKESCKPTVNSRAWKHRLTSKDP